jgi:hypothetical protein
MLPVSHRLAVHRSGTLSAPKLLVCSPRGATFRTDNPESTVEFRIRQMHYLHSQMRILNSEQRPDI